MTTDMKRCTFGLTGMHQGRQIVASVTADLFYDRSSSIEEVAGPYRRLEEDLEITAIENIYIHELTWEPDPDNLSPSFDVCEYDDDHTFHMYWTRLLNRMEQEWFDFSEIMWDNDFLWEDLT